MQIFAVKYQVQQLKRYIHFLVHPVLFCTLPSVYKKILLLLVIIIFIQVTYIVRGSFQKGLMADLQLTDDYDEDEAGYLNVEEFWRNVKLRMIAREYPGFEEKHLTQEIELQNR